MVDQETFSRRLDALDLYLERAERLGEVAETEFAAVQAFTTSNIDHHLSYRAIHEDLRDFLAFRQWALGKL